MWEINLKSEEKKYTIREVGDSANPLSATKLILVFEKKHRVIVCMCENFHSFHTERCDAGAKILPKPRKAEDVNKSSRKQTKRARAAKQPTKLSKYDSSDCIDIDRLQCGFSAYGK